MLYNRQCSAECMDRLANVTVSVGYNPTGELNDECGSYGSTAKVANIEMVCTSPLSGRYVHVKIPREKAILTLCEVEIFGRECK